MSAVDRAIEEFQAATFGHHDCWIEAHAETDTLLAKMVYRLPYGGRIIAQQAWPMDCVSSYLGEAGRIEYEIHDLWMAVMDEHYRVCVGKAQPIPPQHVLLERTELRRGVRDTHDLVEYREVWWDQSRSKTLTRTITPTLEKLSPSL